MREQHVFVNDIPFSEIIRRTCRQRHLLNDGNYFYMVHDCHVHIRDSLGKGHGLQLEYGVIGSTLCFHLSPEVLGTIRLEDGMLRCGKFWLRVDRTGVLSLTYFKRYGSGVTITHAYVIEWGDNHGTDCLLQLCTVA